MPELPEVETIVRQLRPQIVGQIIRQVDIRRPGQWKRNDVTDVTLRMTGRRFSATNRRAKFILCEMDDGQRLIIHLRMSGKLLLADSYRPIDRYSRIIWCFENGNSLQFNDTRALGTLELLFPGESSDSLERLGVEPLGEAFRLANLRDALAASRRPIKLFLLDQTKVVGIGNIYANEILYRCRIHPQRQTNTLSEKEIEKLFHIIPQVLQAAIDHMGTTLGDKFSDYRTVYNISGDFQTLLNVYNREGEPCLACGSTIERIVLGGRSSFVCPQCQPYFSSG